jgi:hypothetical protein
MRPAKARIRLSAAMSFAAKDTAGERRVDLLWAAVAAGLDSSVRTVAARADLAIGQLAVIVTRDVDAGWPRRPKIARMHRTSKLSRRRPHSTRG